MFMPLLLGGGLLGALTNKRNPLEGALLGGALGAATGGMGGLLGNASTAAATGGGMGLTAGSAPGLTAMGGGTGLTMGAAAPGLSAMGGGTGLTAGANALASAPAATSGGLLGNLTDLNSVNKIVSLAQAMTPEQQQQLQAVAPPQMSPIGSQSLVQLYEQSKNNPAAQAIAQREQERMQRKSTMWG